MSKKHLKRSNEKPACADVKINPSLIVDDMDVFETKISNGDYFRETPGIEPSNYYCIQCLTAIEIDNQETYTHLFHSDSIARGHHTKCGLPEYFIVDDIGHSIKFTDDNLESFDNICKACLKNAYDRITEYEA